MRGLVVDNFAGGGGASTGLEEALGRPVDIAINHSRLAIAMHERNHPGTKHFREDIWTVDPLEACGGRPVDVAWFSPDCTHFSRAKGAAPRDKNVRGLAWVVIRWAKAVRPRLILLENVEEFQTWGPLGEDGRPDPEHMGETFRQWLGELRALGYSVDYRPMVAADHGVPTTRKRLFLVARCDGKPIAWPEATHGPGRSHAWRAAADVIDWRLPCPSIFGRKRPLADATLRRIAAGLRRYVIEAARPFVVPVTRTKSGDRVHSIDAPLRTVTTAKGGEFALVAPSMVQVGYGERKGQAPRALDLQRPLGTVVAGGQKHALVTAFLAKHYGGVVGHACERTLGTVTTRDHHSLVTAELAPAAEASFLSKFYGTNVGAPVAAPLPTVTATGQHLAEVRAFLVKYYGSGDTQRQEVAEPLHTVTTRARFGLVTVRGVEYTISDIGLRMLAPRELYDAQGFPRSYVIDLEYIDEGGRVRELTKADQIGLAGNAVNPRMAAELARVNLASMAGVAA